MKKLLFITWDGPQTSYMEGLFMPIFHQVSQIESVEFHVVQFTWALDAKTTEVRKKAKELGIVYTNYPICRKPVAVLGSIYTLFKGIQFLKKYIKQQCIDIVMPRSTMPAIMLNRLRKEKIKILFDADGLAIEERVDFAGLSKASKQYRFFTSEEQKMILKADGVITRSYAAIDYFADKLSLSIKDKFSVVLNGRNTVDFTPDNEEIEKTKIGLGIPVSNKVFVYCGSLGPQYGWEYMLSIFEKYLKINNRSTFLIITGNTEFAENNLPDILKPNCIITKVPFSEVAKLLNLANVAFAIREPKPSMKAVAPIKLGEYLLMGIPTIASKGIGDTEEILKIAPNCFLFDHDDLQNIEKAVAFINENQIWDKTVLRQVGIDYFSLEKSALSYQKAIHKL